MISGFGNALAGIYQGWDQGEDRAALKRDRDWQQKSQQQQFDIGEIQLSEAQRQAEFGQFKHSLDNAIGRLISTQGADYAALQDVYNSSFPDGNQVEIQPTEVGGYQLQFSDGTTHALNDWQELGRLASAMADPNAYLQAKAATAEKEKEAQRKAQLEQMKLQQQMIRDANKYGHQFELEKMRQQGALGLESQRRQSALAIEQMRDSRARELAKARAAQQSSAGGAGGGVYQGTSMDAQDSNILLNGDPNSAEYGLAWHRQFNTPKFVQTDQGMVPIMIPPPAGLRPPTTPIAGGASPGTGLQMPALSPSNGPGAEGEAPTATALPPAGPMPGLNIPGMPAGPVAGGVIPGTERTSSSGPGRPTEAQASTRGYLHRMEEAEKIMTQAEESGFSPSSAIEQARANVPFISNYTMSPEMQSVRAAQDDWIRAKLRKESGASIPPDEMEQERRTYFAVAGDRAATVTQKQQARKIAEESMAISANLEPGQAATGGGGGTWGRQTESQTGGQGGAVPMDQPKILKYNPATGKIE